jgi:iron complex transport system ATP-binding protein
MLELKNIIHRFPESPWELNINRFSVSPGEVQGIIGPNGSGKSTLLRISAGILDPLAGDVTLGGNKLKKLKRHTIARQVGYLPQELSSEYDFTVEELVRMGRYPHTKGLGILNSTDITVVQQSLEFTGLEDLKKRRLSQLSGGEKKRAFLASVLSQKPGILLLDEPASALDLHRQVHFFRLLRKLAKGKIGVAVVTHDINFASLFCDNLLLLEGGLCLAQGPPEKVLSRGTIQKIYGKDVFLGKHPETGRPTLLPALTDEKS